MVTLAIVGGRVLTGDGMVTRGTVVVEQGRIAEIRPASAGVPAVDRLCTADGLLVLPGMVDVHGDAFERQIMPRPGVRFGLDGALLETDRQMVANGITTAYHGITWSWEPGLRGGETATALVRTIRALAPRLACDTRIHLRHETANLAAEPALAAWLREGLVDLLAFNDHLDGLARDVENPAKAAEVLQRSGLDDTAYRALLGQVLATREGVPASVERLAGVAWEHGVPVASHDDETPAGRRHMHHLGSRLCEFPCDAATARSARNMGDAVILGAPNVLRGGSHCGRLDAMEAIGAGLCTVLASDYAYPALLQAVFRIAEAGVAVLSDAWSLVSANAADALGLEDRGSLTPGRRGDLVLVDDRDRLLPRVVATFVQGACVHAAVDPSRLFATPPPVAAASNAAE